MKTFKIFYQNIADHLDLFVPHLLGLIVFLGFAIFVDVKMPYFGIDILDFVSDAIKSVFYLISMLIWINLISITDHGDILFRI